MDACYKDLVVSLGAHRLIQAHPRRDSGQRPAPKRSQAPVDNLAEAQARQAVADQQANRMTDEAI